MESTNCEEENKLMDFESDIDTWVIEKDELSLSSHVVQDKSRKDVRSFEMKSMNKENIKKFTSSTDRKALRCFRIHKSMGYQETTPESESDTKRKSTGDVNDHSHWNKKQRLESPNNPDDKRCVEPKLQRTSSASSLNVLNTIIQEKESLSSEEISVMLTEIEGSSNGCQEKNRERLHSIENVSALVETKDKVGDVSPTSLKLNTECSVCKCEFVSLEELKCHESVHKKTSLPNSNQPEESHYQGQKNNLQNTTTTWNRTDFLDNFKSHLINNGTKIPINLNGNVSCNSVNEKFKQSQNKTKFECGMCKFNCSELLIHKSHQILCHSDKNNLVCEYCNYKTSLCTNLANHIRVHFQFNCPHCDYKCSLKASLDAHLLRHHSEKRYYQCEKCEYSCKSQKKLQKHSQLHRTTTKYQCEECKLFYANKQALKSHIKTHSIEKRTYKCTDCESQFSQKYLLKLHLKSHEQYICDTCNCKFTHKNFLKVHMKVHSQEPLKCKKCNSVFSRKNYLKLHMRIHVPKYSKCEHCPYKCINSSDLSKHICIDKLYEVQKRSLNFQKEEAFESCIENSKTSNGLAKKGKSDVTSFPNNDIKTKNQVSEMKVDEAAVRKKYKRRKFNKDQIRVTSLRQNLPSRKSLNAEENNSDIHGNLKSALKEESYLKKTVNNAKQRKTLSLKVKKKISSKQNNWVVNNRKIVMLNSHNKMRKKLNKYQLCSTLNMSKMFCGGKALSPKDLLVEPVMFTNENYIQCYYQSQQSTLQDHLDRHLRQSNLLSCRFCMYKTNSRHLLQRHTASNHTWDPALVSTLFS